MKPFLLIAVAVALTQPRPNSLALQLKKRMDANFNVQEVTLQQGSLRIVSAERQVSESIYHSYLTVVCSELTRSKATPAAKEIVIVNRFQAQGWVFEQPSDCDQLLNTPAKQLQLFIAARTHLF